MAIFDFSMMFCVFVGRYSFKFHLFKNVFPKNKTKIGEGLGDFIFYYFNLYIFCNNNICNIFTIT